MVKIISEYGSNSGKIFRLQNEGRFLIHFYFCSEKVSKSNGSKCSVTGIKSILLLV